MSWFSLLVCGSVLCLAVTTTTGSYSYGHLLLMKAGPESKRLPNPYSIHRRQANTDQEEICNAVLVSELCANGYYEELARLAGQCTIEGLRSLRDMCQSNSLGMYCGAQDPFRVGDTVESVCGRDPKSCAPECRELLATTRAKLGCCITLYNTTNGGDLSRPEPFSHSLWSLCGVEPVTEGCTGGTVGVDTQRDFGCTKHIFTQRLYTNVICKGNFVESIQKALKGTEGCADNTFYKDTLRACTVNQHGSYCNAMLNPHMNYIMASDNCKETTVCDTVCAETLLSINGTFGCCFNEKYNSSRSHQEPWLTQQFWSQCGLASPGMCESKLSGMDSLKLQNIIIITLLCILLIVALVLGHITSSQ